MYKFVDYVTTKTFIFFILLLSIKVNSHGQDGSDIRYFKTSEVDSSLVGEYVHFGFFRRSFGGKIIDTATISMNNKAIRFVEARNDNGFNNWFSEQYLQSVEKIEEHIARISKFKLDSITNTSFYVTMYLDFYDLNNKLIADKSRQSGYWFNKKDIVEVLVSSKQF